jgi:hypothetical protein
MLWNGERWGAEIARVASTRIQVHYDDGTSENIARADVASREITPIQQIFVEPSPDIVEKPNHVGRQVEKYFPNSSRVHVGKVIDLDLKSSKYRIKFQDRDGVEEMSETQVKNILMTQSEASESFDVSREITARGKKRKLVKKKSRLRKAGEKKKKKKKKRKSKELRMAERILKRRELETNLVSKGLLFMEAELSGDDDGENENGEYEDLDQDLSGFIDDSTPTREKSENENRNESLESILDESNLSQNIYRKFVVDSPNISGKRNRLRHLSSSKVCKSVYQTLSDTRVHHGYKCDECGADPICGVRYHCKTCGNVDYCETCVTHSDSAELHADHEWLQYSQVVSQDDNAGDDETTTTTTTGRSNIRQRRDPLRDVN